MNPENEKPGISPTPRASKEVIDRWEAEGGRPKAAVAEECGCVVELTSLKAPNGVDHLEDAIMSVESPEGQPPPRDLRNKEWKWVGIAAAVLLVPGMLIVAAMVNWA